MWSSSQVMSLCDIELPLIQAPMAGANDGALALAVAKAGGLGSLPCAMLSPERLRDQLTAIRKQWSGPLNLNFFCHTPPLEDAHAMHVREQWDATLAEYYTELNIDQSNTAKGAGRQPFDESMCEVVEEFAPKVVSFHFGLPDPSLVERVRAAGARILSSATTVLEAQWLEGRGCDAIIAQGLEAGGHRGMFLSEDINTQLGTMALVPQVVDAVRVPVIAAGGIVDARGVAAAFMLGAEGVQMGSTFLRTQQSLVSALHREALDQASFNFTALTNVFSGRPARGLMNRVMRDIGPLSPHAPEFPNAGVALGPLKKVAEAAGSADFSSLWSGQNTATSTDLDAGELLRSIATEAQRLLAH